jgi:CheY-like chemotaxis protein
MHTLDLSALPPLPPDAPHVLVVEDNEIARTILCTFLHLHGYAPTGAIHGAEALELLQADEVLPAAILLDLAMPVMTGQEFRAAQLADARLATIPVIVVSAFATSSKLGSVDDHVVYLPKPVDYDLLLATLAELCPRPAGQIGG